MAIINNLIMNINGQNIVVYPNTVGRAVYINESNGYNLIQALEDLRNNSTSEWADVKNKPFNFIGTDFKVVDGRLQLNGSFSMEWDTIQNKPTVFNSSWGRITGKPTIYPSDWSVINNKPIIYNSNWESVENKPDIYPTNWNTINEKPNFFESEWYTVSNKPFNLLDNNYFYVDEADQLNKLSILPNVFVPFYDVYKNETIANNNIPYLYYNGAMHNGGSSSNILPHLTNIAFVGGTYNANDDIIYYIANGLGINKKYLFVDVANRPINNMVGYYTMPENSSYFFSLKSNGIDSYPSNFPTNNNPKYTSWNGFNYYLVTNASHLFENSRVGRNLNIFRSQFPNCINFNNFYYYPQNSNGGYSFTDVRITGDFSNADINYLIHGYGNSEIVELYMNNFNYLLNAYNRPMIPFIANFQCSTSEYADVNFLNIRISNCNLYAKNLQIQRMCFLNDLELKNADFLTTFNNFNRVCFLFINNMYLYNSNFLSTSIVQDGILGFNSGWSNSNIYIPAALIQSKWIPYSNSTYVTRVNAQYPFLSNGLYSFPWLCLDVKNIAAVSYYGLINNTNIMFNGSKFAFYNCKDNFSFNNYLGSNLRLLINTSESVHCAFYSDPQSINSFSCYATWTQAALYDRSWSRYYNEAVFFNFINFASISEIELESALFNNINQMVFNFDNSFLANYSNMTFTSNVSFVNILGGFQSLAKINIKWTDYTLRHNANINYLCFTLNNFYQLSSIELFNHSYTDYYQELIKNFQFYLPDETPYSREGSISQYGIFHYNNETVSQFKKEIIIHGGTDLDNRWQNVALALNDFFNITDTNIINNEQWVPVTNGYCYQNFNLYINNATRTTMNFISSIPFSDSGSDYSNMISIKFTNTLPENVQQDFTNYHVYGSYTYNTNITVSYFNVLDNTFYLYKPDEVQLYAPLDSRCFVSGGLYTLLHNESFIENTDEIIDVINNINFIYGSQYGYTNVINGNLELNNSFKLDNYTSIKWLYQNTKVKNVYIPESARDIFQLYYNCQYIRTAQCPSNVVNLNQTYMYCNNLITGVIGPKVIDAYMSYAYCNNLKYIEINGNEAQLFNTFYFCNSLNGSFTFDNYKANVTSPFYGSAIEELKIKGNKTTAWFTNVAAYLTNLRKLEIDQYFLGINSSSMPSFYPIAGPNDYLPSLEYIVFNDTYDPELQNWHWGYGSLFGQCNPYMPLLVYQPGANLNAFFNYSCITGCSATNLVVGGFIGNWLGNDWAYAYSPNSITPNMVLFEIGNHIYPPYTSFSSSNGSSPTGNSGNIVLATFPEDGGNTVPYYGSTINFGQYSSTSLLYGAIPYSKNWVEHNNSYFNIGYTYNGCTNMIIPSLIDDYNNFTICNVYYAYHGCPNLVIAIGPSGRQGSYKNIESCFTGCGNLRLVLGGTYKPINIYNSFHGCSNIKKLLGNFNNIYGSFNGAMGSSEAKNTDLNLKANSITYSFAGAGGYFSNVNIEANNLYYSFSGLLCQNTLMINTGNLHQCFNGCGCKNLIVNLYECQSSYGDYNDIGLNQAFCGMPNLENLDISVTYYTLNNAYQFGGECFWSTPNLTRINFYNINIPLECNNSEILPTIMNTVRMNGHANLTTVRMAALPAYCWQFFYNCPQLVNLYIENTDYCTNASMMFYNCVSLTQPIILNNAMNMFMTYYGCISLNDCYCGPKVSNMQLAYYNCVGIPYVNIGPNVTDITAAFIGCTHINRNIVFNSPFINNIATAFEFPTLGYNYFVLGGCDTNDTIFNMQNDILKNYFVNCPEEYQSLMIEWTIDSENSYYYNNLIGLNVYYS